MNWTLEIKPKNITYEVWCDHKSKYPKRNVPIIPPLPEDFQPCDPNPVVAICGECNLELRRVMHYWCSNSRCPCQRKIIC